MRKANLEIFPADHWTQRKELGVPLRKLCVSLR